MTKYYPEPDEITPGDWEHRGLDCDVHGINISFAKPKGSRLPYQCVACLLEAARSRGWRT